MLKECLFSLLSALLHKCYYWYHRHHGNQHGPYFSKSFVVRPFAVLYDKAEEGDRQDPGENPPQKFVAGLFGNVLIVQGR